LKVTLSGTSQNAARYFGGPGKTDDGSYMLHSSIASPPSASRLRTVTPAITNSAGKLPALPAAVNPHTSPYAQPAGFGARAKSASGHSVGSQSHSGNRGHAVASNTAHTHGVGSKAAWKPASTSPARSPSSPHTPSLPQSVTTAAQARAETSPPHASDEERELELGGLGRRGQSASTSNLQNSSHMMAPASQTLLRKAVFGDSKARQVAADVMRIHLALDKALVAAEKETFSAGEHSADSQQAHASVARLRTYASALVTMISGLGVSKAMPEVIRDLCIRIATGVNDAAEDIDAHLVGASPHHKPIQVQHPNHRGVSGVKEGSMEGSGADGKAPSIQTKSGEHAGGASTAGRSPTQAKVVLEPIGQPAVNTEPSTHRPLLQSMSSNSVKAPDATPAAAPDNNIHAQPSSRSTPGAPTSAREGVIKPVAHHHTPTPAPQSQPAATAPALALKPVVPTLSPALAPASASKLPAGGLKLPVKPTLAAPAPVAAPPEEQYEDETHPEHEAVHAAAAGGHHHEEDDSDEDGFAAWAEKNPTAGHETGGEGIASVVREPTVATPTAPASSPPAPASSMKSPIPKLGFGKGGSATDLTPGTSQAASFQDEFMANHETWSDSWREEAGATVKTHGAAAAVEALQRNTERNTVPEEPEPEPSP
jgi:hypothetical protein